MADTRKQKFKERIVNRRTSLDDVKKDEMLAILIRNRGAFDSVKDVFSVDKAAKISDGHGLVWKIVRDYVEQHNELPARSAIEANIHNEIKNNPEVVDHEELPNVDEFLDYAFDAEHGNIAKSKGSQESGVLSCKLFMEEILAAEISESLTREGTFPIDLVETVEKGRDEINQIGSLTAVNIGKPFPDGWDTRERTQLFTTGVGVFDTFLGGGWQAGELLLFMGPFGSCKTATTCNGVANLILYCRRLWEEWMVEYRVKIKRWRKKLKAARAAKGEIPKKPKLPKKPVVILVFTEGDENTYRNRLLSNLSTVLWKRLNTMKSVNDLSDAVEPGATNETKYEKREFKSAAAASRFKPERRRVLDSVILANDHLLLVNFTGSGTAKIGKGGVPELANVLISTFRRRPEITPIAMYLDHLSAMANRMVMGNDEDGYKLRSILKNSPQQCRDMIGTPLMIPIAIMHQLSGEANQRSTVATFSHADAADCKSVAEFVDHAFVTGPPDAKQLCVFANTKHRREPPSDRRVVRVVGQFNRIVDVSKKHFVDSVRRRVISRDEEEAYQTAARRKSLKSMKSTAAIVLED